MALRQRTAGGQLAAWTALVAALSLLNYGSRLASGKPPKNALYHWDTAAGGLVQYAVILVIVLWIAGDRSLLALRRPRWWGGALGTSFGILIGIFVLSAALDPFLHPGREQGLTPSVWQSAHAAAFVANFAIIAGFGPVVEELTFRGLGYSLLERFGQWPAIVLVGIAFAAAHGLVEAFPVLFAFGAGLAYLRARSDSVYPGMILHGFFNGLALVLAVST